MTRARKSVGRITVVGAGPGDPGLLTRRATEAVAAADHIIYDRSLAGALRAGPRSTLSLTVDASSLAQVRDGLLAAGVDGTVPVAITGDGTGETQYTTSSTVDTFVEAALGFAGSVVLTLGSGVEHRQ